MPESQAPMASAAAPEILLEVDRLEVHFPGPQGGVKGVDQVSFQIARGEKFALVGESGSGKTLTALAILRLTQGAQVQGQVRWRGQDLATLGPAALRRVRGREIAMIFQEPMTALNPLYTIGNQIGETLTLHEGMTRAQARTRAIEMLDLTGIPEPQRRVDSYPHALSGGQRQRAMIAMALACQPALLIADEPTTALDVTLQRQIVELLESLQRQFGMAVLLITHDLPLVRRFADRVGVMQGGHLLETGPTEQVFAAPTDPYTRRLIESRPQRQILPLPADAPALLRAEGVGCRFWLKRGVFGRRAFDAVSALDLTLSRGETLGIVGESGSGKTTLGLTLLRLASGVSSGRIALDGVPIQDLSADALRPHRRRMQCVFQDPYSALSPRMTIERIVGEGLALHRPDFSVQARRDAVTAMLEEVGLSASALDRYPHEFSGGQRQRIAIARAVIVLRHAEHGRSEAGLLLLDEPTSALDVSVQQQVLALLTRLQQRDGLSYLFITHDLAVIRAMAHRVMVMKEGRVVEVGETEALFTHPQHPYTQTLLAAVAER